MCDFKKYNVSDILDLYEKDNYCEIFGEVCDLEFQTLSSGRISANFDVVDSTAAIGCMKFLDNNELASFREDFNEYTVKNGLFVKVYGKISTAGSTKIIVERISIVEDFNKYVDTASKKRVELHLGTNYSNNFDSCIKLRKLKSALEDMEHIGVGITDYGSVQSYPDAYDVFNGTIIKVLYGVELDLSKKDSTEKYNSIIYVKEQDKLNKFYRFMSEYLIEYEPKNLSFPKSKLDEYRDAIFIGSGNGNGELYCAIIDGKSDEEVKEIAMFYDFLEIQPVSNIIHQRCDKCVLDVEFAKEVNKKIVRIGEELGKLVVATGSVKYLDKKDYVCRNFILEASGIKGVENDGTFYFRTTNEMLDEFSYLGDENANRVVIENTNNILNIINSIEPIPRGTFYPQIDGADEILKNTCYNRAKEIYGEKLCDLVKNRLESELEPTIKNEFSSIYCIAQRVVEYMKNNNKLFFSRGTLDSSFIAFLMGITEINPLPAHYCCPNCKHTEFFNNPNGMSGFDLPDKKCPKCEIFMNKDGQDIPFETLGGFEGDKEPSIALNSINIHEVLDKILDAKNAHYLGEVDTPFESRISSYLEKYIEDKNIFINSAVFRNYVRTVSGIKEKTSLYRNRLIFLPNDKEIYDFTPIQYYEGNKYNDKGIIYGEKVFHIQKITHFDYRKLCGRLVSMVFVSCDNRSCEIIRPLEELYKITGIDPMSIPMDDKKTLNIFTSTESLNFVKNSKSIETGVLKITEFDNEYKRDMLLEAKPKTFTELVRFLGLLHGTNVWTDNAQELIKDNGLNINDVICNRDDIMNYLLYKGLDREKAYRIMDRVRKGRGLDEEMEQYMMENGIPNWYIASCNKIQYLFPKAHSVSYMLMIYRIAYFKVHYPEAFYATFCIDYTDDEILSYIDSGLETVQAKMEEIRKLGMDVKYLGLYWNLEVIEEMLLRKIDFNKVKELIKEM